MYKAIQTKILYKTLTSMVLPLEQKSLYIHDAKCVAQAADWTPHNTVGYNDTVYCC